MTGDSSILKEHWSNMRGYVLARKKFDPISVGRPFADLPADTLPVGDPTPARFIHLASQTHNIRLLLEMRRLASRDPFETLLLRQSLQSLRDSFQARHFQEAAGVTGITLTKLDGTAKGGIIFAISKQLQLPIRFIGVGEQAEDLRTFVAAEFVDAVFADQPIDNENNNP